MLTFFIGTPFELVGALQKDDKSADFSGWSLVANLYDPTGTKLISPLTITWLDQTTGLLTMSAPSTDAWPAGKARIDVKLTTPVGIPVFGPPTYLRIEQSPLS